MLSPLCESSHFFHLAIVWRRHFFDAIHVLQRYMLYGGNYSQLVYIVYDTDINSRHPPLIHLKFSKNDYSVRSIDLSLCSKYIKCNIFYKHSLTCECLQHFFPSINRNSLKPICYLHVFKAETILKRLCVAKEKLTPPKYLLGFQTFYRL